MFRIVCSAAVILIAAALTGCDWAPAPEGAARDAVDANAAQATQTAQTAELEPAADAQTPQIAAPPPIDGYDWYSRVNNYEGRSRAMELNYEVPETDDQPLSITCDEGARRVFVNRDSGVQGIKALEFTSGAAHGRYLVIRRVHSDLSDGDYLTVEIPWSDPLLRAFADTGWITLATADGDVGMAAVTSESKARIAAFLAFCGGT